MKYLNKVCRVYKDRASPLLNLLFVLFFHVEALQHVSYLGSI